MMELKDAVKHIADRMYGRYMNGATDYRMWEEINMTSIIYHKHHEYIRKLVLQYIKTKHGRSL